MPGVLSGLVAGIEANRETALRQQQLGIEKTRLGIEQQRASLEQAQVDRQNRRQDLVDKLDANHQEISDIMQSAAPDRAVLAQAPPAPTGTRPTDPAAAAQWDAAQQKHDAYVNSDQYKSAVSNLNQVLPQFQEATGKHRALLGKMAGEYTAEVNDEFPRTDFNISRGAIDSVSGRELGNWYVKKYGLPAEHWAVDPKTGTSQAQQDALQIQQGLQTGQWDGKEAAVSALFPELHLALGQQLPNGNVVTAAQATHIGYDPKDPNYLLIGHALQHADAQGNHGVVHSPALADDGLRIPVSEVQRRVGEFFSGVNLSQRPDVQAKLSGAVANGDTAYHEFMRVAGAAGVPPPHYNIKTTGLGGYVVEDPVSGLPVPGLGKEGRTSASSQLAQNLQEAIDSGDQDRIDEAYRQVAAFHPSKYAPGGGGAGAGPAKVKYTTTEQNDAKESLRNRIAEKYGAELTDLAKGQDPFGTIKDPAQAKRARQEYERARQKMDNDFHVGKPEVDFEDYVPKDAAAPAGQADFVYDPNKPRGSRITAAGGK